MSQLCGGNSAAVSSRVCVVDGCVTLLAHEPKYSLLRGLCTEHMKADAVKKRDQEGDGLWRYCQQCGKLEPLEAFDGHRRSCRVQLARRRAASFNKQVAAMRAAPYPTDMRAAPGPLDSTGEITVVRQGRAGPRKAVTCSSLDVLMLRAQQQQQAQQLQQAQRAQQLQQHADVSVRLAGLQQKLSELKGTLGHVDKQQQLQERLAYLQQQYNILLAGAVSLQQQQPQQLAAGASTNTAAVPGQSGLFAGGFGLGGMGCVAGVGQAAPTSISAGALPCAARDASTNAGFESYAALASAGPATGAGTAMLTMHVSGQPLMQGLPLPALNGMRSAGLMQRLAPGGIACDAAAGAGAGTTMCGGAHPRLETHRGSNSSSSTYSDHSNGQTRISGPERHVSFQSQKSDASTAMTAAAGGGVGAVGTAGPAPTAADAIAAALAAAAAAGPVPPQHQQQHMSAASTGAAGGPPLQQQQHMSAQSDWEATMSKHMKQLDELLANCQMQRNAGQQQQLAGQHHHQQQQWGGYQQQQQQGFVPGSNCFGSAMAVPAAGSQDCSMQLHGHLSAPAETMLGQHSQHHQCQQQQQVNACAPAAAAAASLFSNFDTAGLPTGASRQDQPIDLGGLLDELLPNMEDLVSDLATNAMQP